VLESPSIDSPAAASHRPDSEQRAPRRGRGYVFISFKTEERDVAYRLKNRLERSGYQVWWQEEIQCGQEWHGELDRAVASASCIIVIWSARSMSSTWVRHEASQAMARGVYAPARIEPMAIDPPFNRIQATDLIGWQDQSQHPGLEDLLGLVERLMPAPVPPMTRFVRWLRRNKLGLVAAAVAAVALATLAWLAYRGNVQVAQMESLIERQETVAQDVQRALHPIQGVEVTATIAVRPKTPELATFEARLAREIGPRLPLILRDPTFLESVVASDAQGPLKLEARPDSPLWPSKEGEPVAFFALRYINLRLAFYLSTQAASPPAADLTVDTTTSSGTADPRLNLNLRNGGIAVVFNERPDPKYWRRASGKITSVMDLTEATLEVSIENIRASGIPIVDASLARARASLGLEMLVLRIDGREFVLRQADLQPQSRPDGLPCYAARLREGDSKR
jgi:hypothetical protein